MTELGGGTIFLNFSDNRNESSNHKKLQILFFGNWTIKNQYNENSVLLWINFDEDFYPFWFRKKVVCTKYHKKGLICAFCKFVCRQNLILTCGATHGLQMILTTILHPSGIIFIEEATYMIALDMFKQFSGMKIVTG